MDATHTIEMRVEGDGQVVRFVLEPPVSFVTFAVSDGRERVLWELSPDSMKAESVDGYFVSFDSEARLGKMLNKWIPRAPDELMNNFRTVDSIVYGTVPDGYSENAKAIPLEAGELYAAIIMRLNETGFLKFSI